MNQSVREVFVEQSLPLPGSANDEPNSLCLELLNVSIQQEKKVTGPLHYACSL